MADLNANLILQGQSPNMLAQYSQGRALGRQAAMENMLRQNAGGLMQGDPQALNALAAYDPQLAQGMQLARTQEARAVQAHDLDMRAKSEGLRIRLAQEKRAILEQAASMDKAQREEAAAKLEAAVRMGLSAQTPEQWDAIMSQRAPEYVGMFDSREMLANEFISTADALKNMQGPEPKTQIVDGQLVTIGQDGATAAPIQGFTPKDTAADEYQRYAQEETAAGRQPLSRIDYAQAKKGNGISMTMPDGTVVRVGGKSDGGGLAPSSPQAMIDSIDGILNDPALDTATGMFSFLQAVPGTPQRRFGARAAQLEGQAFLQAFESLKGGGQITEIEGTKATQAIGRLDTAQSANDYRQALIELRDLLELAQSRPPGWAQQQSAKPQDMPNITDEAGYNALPSGTVFIAPDGTQRRKP